MWPIRLSENCWACMYGLDRMNVMVLHRPRWFFFYWGPSFTTLHGVPSRIVTKQNEIVYLARYHSPEGRHDSGNAGLKICYAHTWLNTQTLNLYQRELSLKWGCFIRLCPDSLRPKWLKPSEKHYALKCRRFLVFDVLECLNNTISDRNCSSSCLNRSKEFHVYDQLSSWWLLLSQKWIR